MDSLKNNNPKNKQKSSIDCIANIDQHKIIFPLTPNLISFGNKNFSFMTSWSRDYQVPAENVYGEACNFIKKDALT